MAKKLKKLKVSNGQFLWLSILLLVMVIEAVYIMKLNHPLQAKLDIRVQEVNATP